MSQYQGSLIHQDYHLLVDKKYIYYDNFNNNQIQPSSIDLTLSEECYEISASFLSPSKNVKEDLKDVMIKKISLDKKYIFKKNKIYLVKLNEIINLPNDIFGFCNPKSSTGRLDIFCRTILNHNDEYEKIPKNYQGEMFIEITSRSFDIEFQKGDSLNQMRLIYNKHVYLSDKYLKEYNNNFFLTLDKNNTKIPPNLNKGLKISVDLSSTNEINGYLAKKNAPLLIFQNTKNHKEELYWEKLKIFEKKLEIKKNNFYILKSKEKIQIPKNMAGEMVPYDTGIGDFRVHYAGFFDPGFGDPKGSYAVLEVKTNELPFILEDGQTIARIKYEKLNKKTHVVYGSTINSNYQNQKLALSKHFK
mgnify:CR=1 FL=1